MARHARIRRTLADRRGATAVETALVLMSLLLVVIGIMEFSIQLAVQAMLDFGAREASRAAITGYAPENMSREDYIRKVVSDSTYSLLDQDKLVVVLRHYDSPTKIGTTAGKPELLVDLNGNGRWDPGESFTDSNGNGRWDPDVAAAGPGGSREFTVYDLYYTDDVVTRLFGDRYRHATRVVVRNEPYPG